MSNRRSYSASQYTGGSKKRGMSPGRSMAQFGHAGHAGKSQSQAKKHQKAGINTPSSGPGSNPNIGQTPPRKTTTVSTPKKTTIKKGITATKAAGKTAKELAYLKSLGRLFFAGDPTPTLKMIGGQYVYDKTAPTLKGLGSAIKNLFSFSKAHGGEPSEDELNILKATGQLKKQKADITGTLGIDSGTTELGPRPDLTDPYIQSKIAGAAGLTTTPQTVGGKKVLGVPIGGDLLNLPTSSSLDAMKQMQIDKRENLMSLEDVQQKASDFEYPTSLDPEQTKTIYDMVRVPGQRTLVADGGLINLFKYGGFLG